MNDIEIPIELPLDDDGFLRRECPNCEKEFKWYSHTDGVDAEPVDQYFCPLCGEPAGVDSWWTPAQMEYVQSSAGPAIDDLLGNLMKETFKGIRGVTYKPGSAFSLGTPTPEPLHEPNDMIILEPPCHPNEPVKVPESQANSAYCLVCGAAFAT